MSKRIMLCGYGCCLLLAILLLCACSDDSGSSPVVSKSWSSLGITDSYELHSVLAVGSKIYAGGLSSENHVSLRILESDVQTDLVDVSEQTGVSWGIVDDPEGNIYVGWTAAGPKGYVSKYDLDTGAVTDTGLTGAAQVYDLYCTDSLLWAVGVSSGGAGMVSAYDYEDGSSWITIPDTPTQTAGTMTFYEEAPLVAGQVGSGCFASLYKYNLTASAWIPYQSIGGNAGQIWDLVVDGSTIYAGGTARNFSGKVWKLQGNESWSDLNIPDCGQINALLMSSDGILYAGGIDTSGYGQVWMYRVSDDTWASTGLKDSYTVYDLTETDTGAIYAVGEDLYFNGQMWKYQ